MSQVFNCKCCGQVVHDLSQYVETRYGRFMADNSYCYCCSYWNLLVSEDNVYICDQSIVYRDYTCVCNQHVVGEPIRFRTLGDQTVRQSNNLWPIARVPKSLRDVLKPNIQILLELHAV